MFTNTRTFLTKSAALVAIVVGLAAGSYGVASAATGSDTATPAAATAPVAPPGATAQNP
jgi:hypothetical protein